MEINHRVVNSYHLVELVGRLDAVNNSKMEDFFNKLLDNPNTNILVDCEKLDFINSSGLRVFIMALKKLKANHKKMILSNLQKNIKKVFVESGFTNFFQVDLNSQQAIAEANS
jgi:anti-anti-sigma factor